MVEQNVDMVAVNPDAIVKTRRIIADAEQRVLMQRMKALEGKVFGMGGLRLDGQGKTKKTPMPL